MREVEDKVNELVPGDLAVTCYNPLAYDNDDDRNCNEIGYFNIVLVIAKCMTKCLVLTNKHGVRWVPKTFLKPMTWWKHNYDE